MFGQKMIPTNRIKVFHKKDWAKSLRYAMIVRQLYLHEVSMSFDPLIWILFVCLFISLILLWITIILSELAYCSEQDN